MIRGLGWFWVSLALACAAPPSMNEDGSASDISGANPWTTTTTTTITTAAAAASSESLSEGTSTTAGTGVDTGTDTDSDSDSDTSAGTTSEPRGYCGDKILQAGEACDEGSGNSKTGGCLPDCTENVCGDGNLWIGVEGCDKGEANGADAACTPECEKNVCGDGYRLKYIEACDDGEGNGDDAMCTDACELAHCGDGLVWADVEECDDGNGLEGDGCTNKCVRENVVFITEAVFTGDLGGVAGADAICQEAAKLSGMLPWPSDQITYRAWIADPACPPKRRLPHSARRYARVDGIVVATDWEDFVDGKLKTGMYCTENHNYLLDLQQKAWSAVHGDGSNLDELASRSCNTWTLSGDFFFGAVGDADAFDGDQWTHDTADQEDVVLGCHSLAHVYCVQIHCAEFPEACAADYCG